MIWWKHFFDFDKVKIKTLKKNSDNQIPIHNSSDAISEYETSDFWIPKSNSNFDCKYFHFQNLWARISSDCLRNSNQLHIEVPISESLLLPISMINVNTILIANPINQSWNHCSSDSKLVPISIYQFRFRSLPMLWIYRKMNSNTIDSDCDLCSDFCFVPT